MKKIKIGQIGIGHNHAEAKMRAIRKFPQYFEVVGVCEPNADWIKERGNWKAYKGLNFLTEKEILEKCDAVLVETDVWDLTQTAQRCVQAGKHIHLDKPASGNYQQYEEVLRIAKEKNLVVQLGYMYRYNSAIQKCMKMIQEGELGEIYAINAEMSTFHNKEYRDWLNHFDAGIMYILGSHLVDLIVYILGEPKEVVSFLKSSNLSGTTSKDNNQAILNYEKALARINVSSVEVNGWGRRQFVVSGSNGTVEIKPMENPCKMMYSNLKNCPNSYQDSKEIIEINEVSLDCRYDEMIEDFYRYIVGEKKNPYTYEHELLVHKVLAQVCQGYQK